MIRPQTYFYTLTTGGSSDTAYFPKLISMTIVELEQLAVEVQLVK